MYAQVIDGKVDHLQDNPPVILENVANPSPAALLAAGWYPVEDATYDNVEHVATGAWTYDIQVAKVVRTPVTAPRDLEVERVNAHRRLNLALLAESALGYTTSFGAHIDATQDALSKWQALLAWAQLTNQASVTYHDWNYAPLTMTVAQLQQAIAEILVWGVPKFLRKDSLDRDIETATTVAAIRAIHW